MNEQTPLSKLPLEQQIAYLNISAYKDSFRLFVNEVIEFKLKNPVFLNELDDIISNPGYKKVCIAMPRGHGKSQHLSFAYPLWEIGKNHNIRILIISKTARMSAGFSQQMMSYIEGNEKYKNWARAIDPRGIGVKPKFRKIAGRRVEEKWSANEFVVDREDLTLKDTTVKCVGLFGSILGGRADLIIADDIVDQTNSQTLEQRQKVKDWFDTTVLPCLVPGGRVLYLGNTWMPDDLISHLLESPLFDYRSKLSAIIHESERADLWNEWGNIILNESIHPLDRDTQAKEFYQINRAEMDRGVEVLWPDLFPYQELYKMRLFNPFSFQRMMMCDATQNPGQRIREEDLQESLRKGKGLRLQKVERKPMTSFVTTGGMDLAVSEKETADYTALLTLDMIELGMGEIKPGDYVIRDLVSGHFSPQKQREIVKDYCMEINYSQLLIESVGYQQALVNDLVDTPGLAGIIKGYKTGGEKNDPDIGVNVIANLFSQGKIILPWDPSDSRTIEEISALLSELRSYPTGHTGDRLMALWFAIIAAREIKRNTWTFPGAEEQAQRTGQGMTQADLERQADLAAIRESNERRSGNNGGWTW